MITAEIDGLDMKLAATGTLSDIIAETGLIIREVWKKIPSSETAKYYRSAVTALVADEDSPLWEKEENNGLRK